MAAELQRCRESETPRCSRDPLWASSKGKGFKLEVMAHDGRTPVELICWKVGEGGTSFVQKSQQSSRGVGWCVGVLVSVELR